MGGVLLGLKASLLAVAQQPMADQTGISRNEASTTLAPAVKVAIEDQFGNLATGYRGSVHFTSSDLVAQTLGDLPPDYTFSSGDAGSHTFSVKLATVGSQTITVSDTVNGALTVTSGSITVTLL